MLRRPLYKGLACELKKWEKKKMCTYCYMPPLARMNCCALASWKENLNKHCGWIVQCTSFTLRDVMCSPPHAVLTEYFSHAEKGLCQQIALHWPTWVITNRAPAIILTGLIHPVIFSCVRFIYIVTLLYQWHYDRHKNSLKCLKTQYK